MLLSYDRNSHVVVLLLNTLGENAARSYGSADTLGVRALNNVVVVVNVQREIHSSAGERRE